MEKKQLIRVISCKHKFSSLFRFLKIAGIAWFASLLITLSACGDNKENPQPQPSKFIIRAADLSFLPEIEETNTIFYNEANQAEDALTILKNAGLNTVRIRLWHNPANGHSGLDEVTEFSARIKKMGLRVWLTVHYSDTWADPGNQPTPAAWVNLPANIMADSVYNYTSRVVALIHPDYFQVGNEINNGMLWPVGKFSNKENFISLVESGCKAVRQTDPECSIIIHYAGIYNAVDFYNLFRLTDFDVIGLSYYPIWHGKDLNYLQTTMQELALRFNKEVVVAETSYAFSLGWFDWTTNVIGDQSQLLADYPPTPEGQASYLKKIREISTLAAGSVGFAYWGGEWIAFKGPQSTSGSSWENQALFDFDHKVLPAVSAFNAQ